MLMIEAGTASVACPDRAALSGQCWLDRIAPFASLIREPDVYERFEEVVLTHTCRTQAELAYGEELVDAPLTDVGRQQAAGLVPQAAGVTLDVVIVSPLVRAIETASDAQRKDLHVVLVTPKIPGNTGCIARTCAASRVPLHLVAPLGFSLDDAQLKRAGLDYWKSVCVKVHDDWDAFYAYWRELGDERGRLVAFSKFGARPHAEDGAYRPGDWLLFGAETTGLPDAAMEACKATGGVRRIPIDESHVRSLNLSVSCGIGVYEALRQLDGSPSVDE